MKMKLIILLVGLIVFSVVLRYGVDTVYRSELHPKQQLKQNGVALLPNILSLPDIDALYEHIEENVIHA